MLEGRNVNQAFQIYRLPTFTYDFAHKEKLKNVEPKSIKSSLKNTQTLKYLIGFLSLCFLLKLKTSLILQITSN